MAQNNDTQQELKKSFKNTLNLPHTDFPIRANHVVDDETLLARWKEENLYSKSFIHNEGKEKFILHDGPPYANGHLHLGSAYNKILKDIVCKFHRMSGKHVPVTPGWDCHGLPIELKVIKESPGIDPINIKKECRIYASKWMNIQREEFKQLGVVMNWDHPYLTMDFWYEASIVKAFGKLFEQGYIEKKNKTVAWCMHDKTVLASAEIEYKERKDPSIYVRFSLEPINVQKLLPTCTDKPVSILVWTTTPWTLPLNKAVLLKPKTNYDVLEVNDEYIIVASALSDKVCALQDAPKKIKTTITSDILEKSLVQHPFIEGFQVPIILDHSVSLDDGTAAVHCAPGCGPTDYDVALKNNLEIFSPISDDGKYTSDIKPEELYGMSVLDGQIWVIKKLTEKGKLYHKTTIRHSYPHCWRCREGLIFRATNQWFCNLSNKGLRDRALAALETISFIPEKAENYLRATIGSRLEWCLSRQRYWGVPIPALICSDCHFVYTSNKLIDTVAQGIEKAGIEYWDTVSLKELGLDTLACKQCQSHSFIKEKDILDVWFDSGISHFAVLYNNPELAFPADMYLEGVDQHRGWFQSSFLTSLIIEGQPSMKSILTHGFIVDAQGQKMSKSIGNVISPQELIKRLGADGLRLWAASNDYGGDVVVSEVLLKNVIHVFQKIRNTCRFLLANLYDFDIDKDAVPFKELMVLDKHALEELYELNMTIKHAYLTNNFTGVFHGLNDYCTVQLSSLYLDIIKDRLYTDKPGSKQRRSAQTACWWILDTITKLMAPIFSFTAEQISDHYQKNKATSIHLQNFNSLDTIWDTFIDPQQESMSALPPQLTPVHALQSKLQSVNSLGMRKQQWQMLHQIRSAVLKAIEVQREKGLIKHSLECRLTLFFGFGDDHGLLFKSFTHELTQLGQSLEAFLKEFFIVSQIDMRSNNEQGLKETEMKGLFVAVDSAKGVKCPRCWQWEETDNSDGLCKRCQSIVG